MRKFRQSFSCALAGLGYTIRTQRNMRIHLLAALAVITMGILLGISRIEWAILCTTIAIVLVAETLNTAIEKAVDLITAEYHPLARVVKNVAAGAVLLAAMSAVIMGFIIFLPYFMR